MVAGPVRELGGGYVEYPLPRPLRNLVHETHQVLIGVPESHPPSYSALEEGCGTGHIEGHHTLVLVPYIHGPVHLWVRGADAEAAQQILPVETEFPEGPVSLFAAVEAGDHLLSPCPVELSVRGELFLLGVLHIAQNENQAAALSRVEADFLAVGGDGTPAVGHAVPGLSLHYGLGRVESVVCAEEAFPVRVEAVYRAVHGVEGVVVAPFLVFGLVVYGGSVYLHLSRREVALEILHIRGRVPQAPLHEGEEFEALPFFRPVAESEFVYLALAVQRHEEQNFCIQAVLLSAYPCIAHTVPAFVEVQRSPYRLPGRRPDAAAFVYIEISSSRIHRHPVVAVAQYASEFRVPAEAVSAGSLGDEGEESVVSEIVYPRPWGRGIGDDILFRYVIEMSKLCVRHIFRMILLNPALCYPAPFLDMLFGPRTLRRGLPGEHGAGFVLVGKAPYNHTYAVVLCQLVPGIPGLHIHFAVPGSLAGCAFGNEHGQSGVYGRLCGVP